MIKQNGLLVVAVIAMCIFAFLYFTKETTVVDTGAVQIQMLKDSIAELEEVYNNEIAFVRDSITEVVRERDSVIKQKNINYWYLKRKHEKEIADILAMPNDSLFILFTRLTDE